MIMRNTKFPVSVSALLVLFVLIGLGCDRGDDPEPTGNLIFRIETDDSQARVNSFGQPSTLPSNHAAQSPRFNAISAHLVELTPNALTLPGNGEIAYQGAETTAGGDNAVDFDQAISVAPGENFISIPLSEIEEGTYRYVRVSVTYQNYDIDYQALGQTFNGTIASFVGFNTFIDQYTVAQQNVTLNENKAQGYWAFESQSQVIQGQAPAGATTVPNPIAATSPIPPGSCLVTGEFEAPLKIDYSEEGDVVVVLSFSTNQSFEWIDSDGNGTFDPLDGDIVVDMGLRGLVARCE